MKTTCQSCRRPEADDLLRYRKANGDVVRNERFLQCDICERHLCADCLSVYDIISGYDFLCRDCAVAFPKPAVGGR